MAVNLSPLAGAGWQFFTDSGVPLAGGKLYTYAAGTTTPETTYTSNTGLTANANPIILNSAGRLASDVWLTSSVNYKFVLKTSTDVTIGTYDNISGIEGNVLASLASTASNALGDALIGFKQSNASGFLSGATARTVNDKLQEFISVKDFGAVGDGTTDDTAAVQAALTSIGAAGGTVIIPNGVKLRIASNLTVPANVTLRGPYEFVGSPKDNTSAQYDALGSIRLASTATITIKGGAGIAGCLIYRYGMTFPAADSSAFAGTAITAGGDDAFVVNSMILGFSQAYSSSGYQRPRIQNTFFDCLSGLLISNCADVGYITENHGWPFATISAGGGITTLQRSGTAFQFTILGDWNKVTNCFAYAYYRGVSVNSCNSMTLEGCGFDSTGSFAGQIGFLIDGTSTDTRISLGQAAAQEHGVYINTTAGLHTTISDTDTWFCTNTGVVVVSGDVSIGGSHRNVPTAVNVINSASSVRVNIRTSNVSVSPVGVTATNNVFIDPACDFYGWAAGSSVTDNAFNKASTIASASPFLLYPNGSVFNVTGTTSFSAINGGWNGRVITLIFSGVLTVTTGGGLFIEGGTFTTAANSTLSLAHNGTAWYETGRKA